MVASTAFNVTARYEAGNDEGPPLEHFPVVSGECKLLVRDASLCELRCGGGNVIALTGSRGLLAGSRTAGSQHDVRSGFQRGPVREGSRGHRCVRTSVRGDQKQSGSER